MSVEVIESFRFTPDALHLADRRPGISAFMRVRDGAFSVEAAIRSHIAHFDEIVVVHNRCTDQTPEILARLEQELAPRLRVFHYVPEVFAPGSAGHRRTPPDAPHPTPANVRLANRPCASSIEKRCTSFRCGIHASAAQPGPPHGLRCKRW